MKKDLRIAVVQAHVPMHKEEGEAQVRRLVKEAVASGDVDMVGLPEDCLSDYEDTLGGYDSHAFLSAIAKENGIYLFGATSVLIDGKLHNRGFCFNRDGVLVGRHDKVVVTPGELEGGIIPGHTLEVFDTEFGRMAVLVCLDSFNKYAAWLFHDLRKAGVEVVLVPSYSIGDKDAVEMQREIDFWVISLRALSRWFKVYIAAPGTIGQNATPWPSFGHALLLSPIREVMAEGSEDKEEILRGVFNAEELTRAWQDDTDWPPYSIPKVEVVEL